LEALVGSTSHDFYDAIFDVECDDDLNIFQLSDDEEGIAVVSTHSLEDHVFRDRDASASPSPQKRRQRPESRGRISVQSASARASPRNRPLGPSSLAPVEFPTSPEIRVSESSERSPLARLFSSRFSNPVPPSPNQLHPSFSQEASQTVHLTSQTEASLKHIEGLLEAVGKLPVQKLKDEMKELQDRQARIENLLLMLTRGMRGDVSHGAGSGTSPRPGTL